MIGADHSRSDLINETGLVDRHKGKSSVDDLTVNESAGTIPDPVPFPEENCREDGKMSATRFQYGEPMHICQGIMTHLTNETVEELNEDTSIDIDEDDTDTIIDIDEDDAGNNANNNANDDANQDDESTAIPMMREVD